MKKAKPVMGSVYSEFPILQFGGLNNRDSSIHIDDTQASDLMNVVFDNKGEISKRNGYTAYTTIDSNPVVSLFTYAKSSGTTYLVATSGTSVFNITGGTSASIKTGLTGSGKRFSAATYKDTLYMVNGTDGVMKWDGTTFATVGGLPFANANYIIVHKNRMYFADSSNTSRIWLSDLGLPESVQTLNFFDINTNDGDKITGISELLDALVIFKERSIHELRGTGPSNYNLLDSHQSHGTVSHWSIVQILNKLYYLAEDGVYSYDGHHIRLESDLIRGSVLGLNGNTQWGQQYLPNACAIDYKNKYWLAITEGTSTSNNRIYALDYVHGIWTRFDIAASCFCLYPAVEPVYLYSGSPTTGKTYKQDNGTSDDGASINAFFRTKDFDFGSPAHYKSFKGLFFSARETSSNYSINIAYIEDIDNSPKTVTMNLASNSLWGTAVWGTDLWGSSNKVITKTTSVSGQARFLAFEVSDNSTNPWNFLGWIIRYQVKRRLA